MFKANQARFKRIKLIVHKPFNKRPLTAQATFNSSDHRKLGATQPITYSTQIKHISQQKGRQG